ncbi:MAG TPA: DUF4150 domain-containing protein [Planctomycetota bacterium]|jgi:uncharacterized protein DUF4150|nr:DUF4150 domain-containing protein [Planctomycetota bacterium]
MFPASSKGGGMCMGFPDVCKTPAPPSPSPIPIPYPNIAQVSAASGGTCSSKVKIENQPVVTKDTEIPSSSGDEAGVAGGVSSSCNMGKVVFKMGSSTVKAEGKDVAHVTSMTSHNKDNFPAGMQLAPSQVKVIVGA